MHKMNLQELPFQMIKNQTKIIECRLYDEKKEKNKARRYNFIQQ